MPEPLGPTTPMRSDVAMPKLTSSKRTSSYAFDMRSALRTCTGSENTVRVARRHTCVALRFRRLDEMKDAGPRSNPVRSATTVVAYLGTDADVHALSMATLFGGPVVALPTRHSPPSLPEWCVVERAIEFAHRDGVGVPDLFAAAVEPRASYVVLSDYDFSPESILDPAVTAAQRACRDEGTFLAVVVVRRRGKPVACPYRRVLVGASSAPAGGFAALVAAHLAWRSGASLKVPTVERRRDSVQRRLFERLNGSSSSFDPSTSDPDRETRPSSRQPLHGFGRHHDPI